eukprot:SAG11_NODE_33637_length_276_cov_0.587571_1_plen_43_part_01
MSDLAAVPRPELVVVDLCTKRYRTRHGAVAQPARTLSASAERV